jgi:hypothetical protein
MIALYVIVAILSILGLVVVFAIFGGILYIKYGITIDYFDPRAGGRYMWCKLFHGLEERARSDLSMFDTGTVYYKYQYCQKCDRRYFEVSCSSVEYNKINQET